MMVTRSLIGTPKQISSASTSRKLLASTLALAMVAALSLLISDVELISRILPARLRIKTQNNSEDAKRPATYPVETNQSCTIASDISAIWHSPSDSSVCVSLLEGSRCPHPSLIGRLSGPSIAMLEWSMDTSPQDHGAEGGTVYCGSYQDEWILEGTYFLEIVIIHCNGFGVTALERLKSKPDLNISDSFEQWLQFNYTDECVEEPANNRLTGDSFLFISKESQGAGDRSKGHWVLKERIPKNETPQVWYTRYQPHGCEGCVVPTNSTHRYSFIWADRKWIQKLSSFRNDTQNPTLQSNKVCFLGASHSRVLVESMHRLHFGHLFVWIWGNWPEEVNTGTFEVAYEVHNCTKFVVQLGQWPASWVVPSHTDGPYSFGKYRSIISKLVNNQEIYNIGRGDIKLFFRSFHHNPLGYRINDCAPRPLDWRSPTVVDAYDYLVKEIVEEFQNMSGSSPGLQGRVQYLDTKFITYPLWDAAEDWCHLNPEVQDVEALYIASRMLLE
ncbi:hypothetical protein ACHAWX_003896 [Stephanocyclus meneghinianus]